jgi:hypothetical protein
MIVEIAGRRSLFLIQHGTNFPPRRFRSLSLQELEHTVDSTIAFFVRASCSKKRGLIE